MTGAINDSQWAEAITIKVYILQGHLPLGIDELGAIRRLDSKYDFLLPAINTVG